MSHTIRRTLRGIEVTIIVNGDWSGDAEVHADGLLRAGLAAPMRACSVPARHLLTGGHPDSVRWPLDVWGAVVAVAVEGYLDPEEA